VRGMRGRVCVWIMLGALFERIVGSTRLWALLTIAIREKACEKLPTSSCISPRENLIALAFAAVLICIMLGGSFWIMFDLYHRMMA
jgi:hypothetical protein